MLTPTTVVTVGVLATGVIVGGCGFLAPPPISIGPCTLDVLTDEGGTVHALQPPFAVTLLSGAVANGSGQTGISVRGTGWQQAQVTITGPDGAIFADGLARGEDISSGIVGWPLDAAGMYRFRVEDDRAGCVREFSLEARPSSEGP